MVERHQSAVLLSSAEESTLPSVELRNDDVDRLRSQLWVGLMITTSSVLLITSIARVVMGDPTPPTSILILGTLHAIVIANLVLRKSRHARLVQGIYVVGIHLAVPPVLVLYGGTRGFGDIALITAMFVSLLYGWQRWMTVSFAIMFLTLGWIFYRDSIGQPVAPLLNYSSQFTALKFFIQMFVMLLILRYTTTFYHGLLDKYRGFANEQVRLNRTLQANGQELEQLTHDLQSSRQKIVTAREEERRRLRRDLHDGLGPTLAAQMFRVGAARNLLTKNPDKTATLLVDLESGIEGTLNDIRRLVYALRPPLLDQLGLLGAVDNIVRQYEGDVIITLELPSSVPPLSAALEVAAFRVVQTALDNVLKHASATVCTITLAVTTDGLAITIEDDGIGISPDVMAGVGLTSMRERAEELGGTFTVVPTEPRGTRVSVDLPIASDGE